MDKICFFLEFLRKMTLYSNIQFLYCGDDRNYDSDINRTFDSYGIQYNHESGLEFAVDSDAPQTVSGSYVFFNKPGYFYHYSMPAAGHVRHHSYVTFIGERVQDYIAAGLLDNDKPELIAIHDPVRFAGLMHQLQVELLHDKKSLKAVHLLDRLLFIIQDERAIQSSALRYYEKILNECEEAIIANPVKEHDFRQWAKKAGVSYAHFRRLFQQHSGFAPKAFLLHNRFNMAVHYLQESDMRIAEIADAAGWDDVYFFSKQFKKKFGVSPLQFRKRNQ